MTEAQRTAEDLLTQKHNVLSDVDTLREALDASQQLIEALESDVEVNRTHSDLLREQLSERVLNEQQLLEQSTSQAEKRANLKGTKNSKHCDEFNVSATGKAYDAKLRIMEQDNEKLKAELSAQRLKTRAFEAKLRVVEKAQSEQQEQFEEAQGKAKDFETVRCDSYLQKKLLYHCSAILLYWKSKKSYVKKAKSCKIV